MPGTRRHERSAFHRTPRGAGRQRRLDFGAATARDVLRECCQATITHVRGRREAAEARDASADAAESQRAVNAANISKRVPHARPHDVSAEDFRRGCAVNAVCHALVEQGFVERLAPEMSRPTDRGLAAQGRRPPERP